MPRTSTLNGLLTSALVLSCSSYGMAQSEQENVFDAGGGAAGGSVGEYLFEDLANWSEGGPGADPWVGNEVDGGISFDVEDTDSSLLDDFYQINIGNQSYTAIDELNILSDSIILLVGDAGTSFTFNSGANIITGNGAMSISGLNLQLEGNMTFDYGNGSEATDDDAPQYITSSDYGINYNLIIEGEINDGGIDGTDSNLIFQGGGYAALTGGLLTEDASEFTLTLSNSSLLLGSSTSGLLTEYEFHGGASLSYGGNLEGRENGHGILQVAGATGAGSSTLDTDGETVDLSGFAALLVGSIDLTDSALADLGFGDGDYVVSDQGTGAVTSGTMTLNNDSVVVVGTGSSITGSNDDNDATLELNGASSVVVQSSGSVDFDALQLNSGSISTSGLMSFDELTTSAAIDILTGGTISSTGDATFNGASVTNVNGGTLTLASSGDDDLSVDLSGDIFVTNGGTFTAGTGTTAGEETTISLAGTLVVDAVDDNSTATFNGSLSGNGSLFALNGGTFTYNQGGPGIGEGTLDLSSMTLGGGNLLGETGNSRIDFSDYTFDPLLDFAIDTLFGGYYNSATGNFEAGTGILEIDFGVDGTDNLTFLANDLIFGIGFDEDNGAGYNTLIDLIGGTNMELDAADSSLALVISGDSYIPTGTVFTLLNPDDIQDGTWDDIEISNTTGSITRNWTTTQPDGSTEPALVDGQVALLSDYTSPLSGGNGVVTGNAQWLQNESLTQNSNSSSNETIRGLLFEMDQLTSVQQYRKAVTALSPNTLASGLQIVSNPASFTAYSEALSEMRNANELGRPGPARRPLGQKSQSLFAAQDEADTVRSQYGYGAGPESGQRRTEDNDAVAFVQGYGRTLDLQNTGEIIGLSANQWGVLTGFGKQVTDNSVLGILVGYDSFSGDLNDGFGTVDVGTVRAGPFFGWSDGTWNVDLALTGAYNDWRGTRNTFLAGTPSYDWNTAGWEIDFSANAGYRIPVGGGLNIVPEASFIYSYIQTDSYTESGGPAPSTVSADAFNGFIGRLGGNLELLSFSGLIIEGSLGWQGNFGSGGQVETSIAGSSGLTSPEYANRNNIYYGTQFTWMPTWDIALSFRYEGRTGDGTDDQYFGGGVSFEF